MNIENINYDKDNQNKGIIFVCKHCGDLFWSSEERDEHRDSCEHNKDISI